MPPPRWRRRGASGFLSVTPYYNKPTQEGLYQHYRAIAESTPLPIVVYNVPGRTGVNVEVATLARLAADSEHRRREGSVRQHARRCARCAARCPPDFIVLSGDDALTLPLMAVGGRGVISVASNEIPARDGADGRGGRAQRLRRGARGARAHPAADADQFRRSEPGAGEGRDGGDGTARGDVPAADGAAEAGVEAEDRAGRAKELGLLKSRRSS